MGSYSWQYLLKPSSPARSLTATPGATALDLRSLAFFHQVVAPGVSGTLDITFWTRTISQIIYSEPATWHATLAISSLYEGFSPRQLLLLDSAYNGGEFAIRHYNLAIKHTVTRCNRETGSLDVILLVCILFICIEFIRGDVESATRHITHGMSLLDAANSNQQLVSIFRNLAALTYFFRPRIREFTEQEDLFVAMPASGGLCFDHISDAQATLDSILPRVVRLVFLTSSHRLAMEPHAMGLREAMWEKQRLERDLDWWWSRFSELRRVEAPTVAEATLLMLEARWIVMSIWTRTCLSAAETVYDDYTDDFLRIIEIANQAQATQAETSENHGKFTFSMGFCPLLHFVTLKCRYLRLRLMALQLMKTVPYQREALWDATTMHAVGMRIVEIEHGLDTATCNEVLHSQNLDEEHLALPDDCQRVRENTLEPILENSNKDDGDDVVFRRRILLVVQDSNGNNVDRHDWITIRR